MTANKSTNQPTPKSLSRRNFLALGVGAVAALTALEAGVISLAFAAPRSLDGEFGGTLVAGPADSFTPGTVTEFPAGRFFLIRAADGGFLAVYRRCTHLGCAVSWEPGASRFVCPCHGSHFDGNGDVNNPPAPRSLDTFAITIEEGVVQVNTSKPQNRDRFESSQLVYA